MIECITEKLPNNVTLIPGSDFTSNFSGLQQLVSANESASYYYIKSVPDAIFVKKCSERGAGSEPSVVHIYNDEGSLLELKPGGRLPQTKSSNLHNGYAQAIGGLHTSAIAQMLKAIKDGTDLAEVKSKGVIINKKREIISLLLQARLNNLGHAELTVQYTRREYCSEEMTLALVCKAIFELFE